MDFKAVLKYVEYVIAGVGVVTICWGVLLTVFELLRAELHRFKGRMTWEEREAARRQFGSYLLIGLEFLIAADVIQTIIHPTLQDIAILGAIVVIRTVIGFFLDREMAAPHRHKPPAGA